MNKRLFKLLPLLGTCVLAGCSSYTFNYVVPPYPGELPIDVDESDGLEDSGSYSIKIWCDQRIEDLTSTQVSSWVAAQGGKYKIDLKIDIMSEDSAATTMLEGVDVGADIFVFAQDQLAQLKTANALAPIKDDFLTTLQETTDPDGIKAATIGDNVYAFPFTSDNGYFLYYDKTALNEDEVKNMATIVAKAKALNKKISYSVLTNGFYTASYFMGAGCKSEWTLNSKNKFSDCVDTINSDKGIIAAKGIRDLQKDADVFIGDNKFSQLGTKAIAAVSGIWNYTYGVEQLGDNLGCCELPSYTVDGKDYHISSFKGYKLLGVKRSSDKLKTSVCMRIARFLTSEACQKERFESVSWAPTNLKDMELPEVLNHKGLKALRDQNVYAQDQKPCPSNWFSQVSFIASAITKDTTDQEIQGILDNYTNNLDELKG